MQRRRRSSLAQLTDILREWSGNNAKQQQQRVKPPLNRRETFADLARNLPWRTSTTTDACTGMSYNPPISRKRRESSADSGIRSLRSRRDSSTTDFVKSLNRRESVGEKDDKYGTTISVVVEGARSVRNLNFFFNKIIKIIFL